MCDLIVKTKGKLFRINFLSNHNKKKNCIKMSCRFIRNIESMHVKVKCFYKYKNTCDKCVKGINIESGYILYRIYPLSFFYSGTNYCTTNLVWFILPSAVELCNR